MKIGPYTINQLPQTAKIFTPRILNNRNWYEKSWGGYLNPLTTVGYGAVIILNRRIPDSFRFAICFIKKDKASWFWDGRDIVRLRRRVLRLTETHPAIIIKWKRDWVKDRRVFQ